MKSISLLLALVASSVVSASRHGNPYSEANIRAEFVRAMNEATQQKEEATRQQSLMKRMLRNARLVKNAFVTQPQPHRRERNLANNGNWNYGYYNYYNRQDDDYQQQDQNQQQNNQKDGDDAWVDYGGLNLTNYALKYLGCQNIHTFSDEMAADQDEYGSLKMDRFVVFRLCPRDSCSNYNDWGCDYNYGEYTLPMEDYLATMQQYHIQQYQEYCQTCYSCMNQKGDFAPQDDDNRRLDYNGGGQYYYYNSNGQYYQKNYGNGNGNNNNGNGNNYNNGNNNNNANNNYNQQAGDDYYAADDAAANDDGNANNKNYEADPYNNYDAYPNDDMFEDDDGANQTYYQYKCMYADVCAEYKDACDAAVLSGDDYVANSEAYSQFFECSEFNVGGSQSYLGPHCRSDGFTIGIGIYEDQYCSSYVGDMSDMSAVTGQSLDDDYLSPYYPKQCISCSARESYDLLTDDEVQQEERDEKESLYEVCGALYEQAAKCNKYLGEGDTYYGQYQQEANEKDVCNFVASLIENNYDEYGEAYLESPEWELAKWKELNSYKQDMMERATPEQILGILASIGLCLVLIGYIVYLRSKLIRRMPWTPGYGTDEKAAYAGRISRVGSGITMQRSLSGLEPGPSGSFA